MIQDHTCKNCATTFTGKYCSSCGQKYTDREHLNLVHFFKEAFHEFTHYDGKIFRSMKFLVTRPGFLSAEYVAGRHKSYISPVSFFILLNLFFYLLGHKFIGLMNWDAGTLIRFTPGAAGLVQHKMQALGMSEHAFTEALNHGKESYMKMMFLFIIPVFALGLWIMFFMLKRTYVEHLIFSVHFYTFNLLFLSLGMLLIGALIVGFSMLLGIGNPLLLHDPYLSILVFGVFSVYIFFAIRRFYALKSWKLWLAALAVNVLSIYIIMWIGKWFVLYMTILTLK